jgi:hypothetical protein
MEKIVKKVMIPKYVEVQSDDFKEVITYKTVDGKEFTSYLNAQQHEDELTYRSLEKAEFEFQEVGDYWYKVKSQEELDALIRHLSRSGSLYKANDIKIGEWFSTHWDIDGEYCDIVPLSEFKKNVEELYKFLEGEK